MKPPLVLLQIATTLVASLRSTFVPHNPLGSSLEGSLPKNLQYANEPDLFTAFRHCVSFHRHPQQGYQNVHRVTTRTHRLDHTQEPYSLSLKPYHSSLLAQSEILPHPPVSNRPRWLHRPSPRIPDYNTTLQGQVTFLSDNQTIKADLVQVAPNTFRDLRNSVFGISEASFDRSLWQSGPFRSFLSNSRGAARAGGVFFFTPDQAYMIKTIKDDEAQTFLRILPKYHQHMKDNRRTSLLTRFCGMYQVTLHDNTTTSSSTQVVTFVVMNSVFPPDSGNLLSERFDLKGSTVGREVSDHELNSKGSRAVLKDLDLAREVALLRSLGSDQDAPGGTKTTPGLCIRPKAKQQLLDQLRKDVALLVDCQLMDYSLLVGVARTNNHPSFQLDESSRKTLQAAEHVEQDLSTKKSLERPAVRALSKFVTITCFKTAQFAKNVRSQVYSKYAQSFSRWRQARKCGVDGGRLAILSGSRNGKSVVYYIGLIDFLQPWTLRKAAEHKAKGLAGYDTSAISCVRPDFYASRFLQFLDEHIS
eukprot:Nitzschia sp. Nitz4//scaffold41_size133979//75831//77541//NITZ4_003354-RA/size133979-snap-gene-0.104-mRNA-1//1//CDS//3329551491//3344//frame0